MPDQTNDAPTCPVQVRISMSKSLWFDLVFVVGAQGRIVETSDTMWNMGKLTRWLEDIVQEKPCPVLEVDREGAIDQLEAQHIDKERVHLRIFDGLIPEDELHVSDHFVNAIVSRKKLIWEIYFELMTWSEKLGFHYRPERSVSDRDWLKLPMVEDWLDWPNHTNPYSMDDRVSGIDRV